MQSLSIHLRCVLTALTLPLLVGSAQAQWCVAQHANGQLVPVRERPGPSMFWAHSSWDMDGWPAITYGPPFFRLPPIMQEFTKFHECAHLAEQTTDEFQANCSALRAMRSRGLSQQQENFIANFHRNIGPIGPQYGGSGVAFWQGTLQACGEN